MTQPWQTRASEFHPYLVGHLGALPESLRGGVETAMPPGARFVSALVVPAEYRSKDLEESQIVPEQALVYTDYGVLHVQAGADGEPALSTTFIQPETLLSMRSSHLVLYGRLELLGAAEGKPAKIDMEFNAIGWNMMDAPWRELVGKAIGLPVPASKAAAIAALEGLPEDIPSKFVEGLRRYGLYTGESLLGVVFQPGVWSSEPLALFDHQLAPNTLLALTNASVLLLEEETALVRKSEQYGLIITRLPRQAIRALQSVTNDQVQEVKFFLGRGGVTAEHRLLLGLETSEQWLSLWTEHVSQTEAEQDR